MPGFLKNISLAIIHLPTGMLMPGETSAELPDEFMEDKSTQAMIKAGRLEEAEDPSAPPPAPKPQPPKAPSPPKG